MTMHRTTRWARRPGIVLPFPLRRRVAFVDRQARHIAGMNAEAGERHLAYQIKLQRDTLSRKGVDPARIDAEIKALEAAIRAALWRAVLAPGGRR